MNTLFLIPARAGSKGIVKKNVREIGGKPLVVHSLLLARKFATDDNICISTDDPDVIEAVEAEGYTVPFVRPDTLSTDSASMRDVMLHALEHYAKKFISFERLVLLQPTSPFRTRKNLLDALSAYNPDIDMVVTVTESKANPYFVLYEEDNYGHLVKSKKGTFVSRQECPKVWQLNGAIYVINTSSLVKSNLAEFRKIKKVEMDELHSIDLDNELDWKWAVFVNEEYKLLTSSNL